MNLEFVEAVINMRKAQKKYFSNRLPSAFEEAKTHEKNVDKKIQKIQKQESPFQNDTRNGSPSYTICNAIITD